MLLFDPQNQDKAHVREMKLVLSDVDSGDDALPTDEEIAGWGLLEDDEGWMDVKFEDLERELRGKKGSISGADLEAESWTDKGAQDNLQRIVSQFQSS